jgi:hypothetical protein
MKPNKLPEHNNIIPPEDRSVYYIDIGTLSPRKARKMLRILQAKIWNSNK